MFIHNLYHGYVILSKLFFFLFLQITKWVFTCRKREWKLVCSCSESSGTAVKHLRPDVCKITRQKFFLFFFEGTTHMLE